MLLFALLVALPVPALAAPGDLDPSFDGDGRVLTDFGGFEEANSIVVQPDGKLVAVGANFSVANGIVASDVVLARYDGAGALDRSFGSAGRVVTDFGGVDGAEALVVQPDGKLVAAIDVLLSEVILARYNPDGSLDASFNVAGVCCPRALVLQPDGKLVLAASSLVRLNPDGTLDRSFGRDGFAPDIRPFFLLIGDALVLQPDGKLVRAGKVIDSSAACCDEDFALVRFNPDGTPDTSFGAGGEVALPFFDLPLFGNGLVLQSDGKLVAGGSGFSSGDADFALARYVTTNEPLAVPPTCFGRPATILGTSGRDILRGTSGPDVILGLGGNDTIRGLEGNDTICGGRGRDRLIGNGGNDRLFGEGQNDKLFGDKGRDRLDGGSGRDACRTGERARRCEGKPPSSKPPPGERPTDPPRPPCPPISNFPCS